MRILVCPLNWGLGHASRDISIIRKLLDRGHEAIIAADGAALELLSGEFPGLKSIRFRSAANITYFRSLPAWLKIFLITPLLGYDILMEHHRLKKIVRLTKAGLIISDNRYGLWHSRIPSVLVTHQLNFRFPAFLGFVERPAAGMIRLMIRKFHRCWIPDHPSGNNLSGELAHKYSIPRNATFTGVLSRFACGRTASAEPPGDRPLLVVSLSGPEPQRTKLENIILGQIREVPLPAVILQGLPGKSGQREIAPGINMCSHLPSHRIRSLLENARYIICRSGYTSVMDLASLGKTAMLIPTPGQTEQEYLSRYLSRRGLFLSMSQKNFNLGKAIRQLEDFKAGPWPPDPGLLEKEMDRLFRDPPLQPVSKA